MLPLDVPVIVLGTEPIVAADASAPNFETRREPAIVVPLANVFTHFLGQSGTSSRLCREHSEGQVDSGAPPLLLGRLFQAVDIEFLRPCGHDYKATMLKGDRLVWLAKVLVKPALQLAVAVVR